MILTKKKKDGTTSYRAKVYVDGHQVTKTFNRKQDAQMWKQQTLVDKSRGVLKEEKKEIPQTFLEFSKEWIKVKNIGLSFKSRDNYQTLIKLHLLPKLAKKKLNEIGIKDGHKLISDLKAQEKSPKGINMIITLLKGMLRDAVRWEILETNRLEGLQQLKVPPKTPTYWMPSDIKKFLDTNKDDELYELWVVALNTGMRRGELAGLCWDKVDFQKRLIHVARHRDRHGLQETTKTHSSFRFIPMNDSSFTALSNLFKNKRNEKFVFAYKDAEPFDVQHITEREFRAAMLRADVPRIRFHDLRATYAANICMAPNGDLYALSKILGHTSVDMTVKRYAHLHNDFLKKVASSVNFE